MDIYEKVLRTGRTRVSLLNDPVLESGQLLGLVPIVNNEIYQEFVDVGLNDSAYVTQMDEAIPGRPLAGQMLETKRAKVAQYIKDAWGRIGGKEGAYKNLGQNNALRKEFLLSNVVAPALFRAQQETANMYPELRKLINDAALLERTPVRDYRNQRETGRPPVTQQRQEIRTRMDNTLTSGGR